MYTHIPTYLGEILSSTPSEQYYTVRKDMYSLCADVLFIEDSERLRHAGQGERGGQSESLSERVRRRWWWSTEEMGGGPAAAAVSLIYLGIFRSAGFHFLLGLVLRRFA